MKKFSFLKKNLNVLILTTVLLVFVVLFLTGALKMSDRLLLEQIAIAALLAVSLGMVVGFLGELSLGHAGFMCVGAYAGGKVASLLIPEGGSAESIPVLLLSLLVGGAVAALFGLIVGLPALRLRGDYLAIVTLGFGEIVRILIMNMPESWFGGAGGLPTPRFADKKGFFIVAILMLILCLLVTQNLMRSKHGRAIRSIRDNEIAARSSGINVTNYKLLVFITSSFFAGIAGVLLSYSSNNLQYTTFDYNKSIEILVMVVLGGMGNINGSIIAATLVTFLDVKLQTTLTGPLAVLQNLVYALVLILIVIYRNAPGLKNFREKYNFKVFSEKLRRKSKKGEEVA